MRTKNICTNALKFRMTPVYLLIIITITMAHPTGTRIEVEVWNYKLKRSEWLPGEIIEPRSGDVGEDFMRYDVKLDDGRRYQGAHPDCIRLTDDKLKTR